MDARPHIDRAARRAAVKRVLLVEMALNLLVAGIKGAFGLVSGSLAIAADAVHSLIDAGSNVIGLFVTGAAAEPPDPGHPYGHRKIEVVAAAAIGVAVGVVAVRFAWGAIESLIEGPEPPATSLAGFAIIGFAFVVNVFVAVYEARRARQLDSRYLAADAAHTASDVLVTIAVIGSFAAAHAGITWADAVGALLVTVVIGRVAWGILSANLGVLVDRAAVDPERIEAITRSVVGVSSCHRVRSRGTGDAVHIDLHLLVDGEITLRRAHDIAHAVEDAIRDELPEVTEVVVHTEPHDDAPEPL